MKKIKYKMRNDGICLTICPFNMHAKVMSMKCTSCLFFGKKIDNNNIICNADFLWRIKIET